MIPVWDERDQRYALSTYQLTDAQVQTVRDWRLKEARTEHERNKARTWTPPPYFKFTTRLYTRKKD